METLEKADMDYSLRPLKPNTDARLHLVDILVDEHGIVYQASDKAYSFVELMRSKYAYDLKARSEWLAENFRTMDKEQMKKLITDKLDRWDIEFQHEVISSGSRT